MHCQTVCYWKPCFKQCSTFTISWPTPRRGKWPITVCLLNYHAPFAVGTLQISLHTKFIVVDDLPYSCIVGLNILHRFDSWGIDNKLCRLQLNNSSLPVFTEPQSNVCNVNLITCYKTRLQPGETQTIKTVAKGPGLDAL